MKLSVKTLQGKVFDIDINEMATVMEVKSAIHEKNGDFIVEKQKLIHAGKVLKDEQIISETGVKEGNFLVVMISKPKRTSTANGAAAEAETSQSVGISTASAPVVQASTTGASSSLPPSAAPTTNTTIRDENSQAPTIDPNDIHALQDMGFPEAECRAAMEASFRFGGGQPLAVEFLMNGIPPNIPPSVSSAVSSEGSGSVTPSAEGTGSNADADALEGLRNHSQFQQLRQLIQSNPAALDQVLQQIGQQQPHLLDAIRANPEGFMRMLNEPVPTAETVSGANANLSGEHEEKKLYGYFI